MPRVYLFTIAVASVCYIASHSIIRTTELILSAVIRYSLQHLFLNHDQVLSFPINLLVYYLAFGLISTSVAVVTRLRHWRGHLGVLHRYHKLLEPLRLRDKRSWSAAQLEAYVLAGQDYQRLLVQWEGKVQEFPWS